MEITYKSIEFKLPAQKPEKVDIKMQEVPELLWQFIKFRSKWWRSKESKICSGLWLCNLWCHPIFETIKLKADSKTLNAIPLMRYRLYQYVIAINHFKDELFCVRMWPLFESELPVVESHIKSKDVPVYPLLWKEETSNKKDEDYGDGEERHSELFAWGCFSDCVASANIHRRWTVVYRASM